MPRPTGPTNPELKILIAELRSRGYKEKIKFLVRIAELLERPTRKKSGVNLGKLQRYCKENENVIIPGKVLSSGVLTKPVNVAAFDFSSQAKEKIKTAGGKTLTIKELIEKNPKGENIRIMV